MNHEENVRSKASALHDAVAAAKSDGYAISLNPSNIGAVQISETGRAKVALSVDVAANIPPAVAVKAQVAGQRAVDKVIEKSVDVDTVKF